MNPPDQGPQKQTGPESSGPESSGPDPARDRFIMLQLMRLGGVLLVVGGILILAGRVPGPRAIGYGLVVFGAFEFFAMPALLARRWKSPQ